MISSTTFLCSPGWVCLSLRTQSSIYGSTEPPETFNTCSCERTLNFELKLSKKRTMSKIISARDDTRVWAKSFIPGNSFFGPHQGDVSQLIKRVQFLITPSVQFKVSATDVLLNSTACFIAFYSREPPRSHIQKKNNYGFFMDLMRWFHSFNGFDFLSQCTWVKIDTSIKKLPSDLS